MFCQLENTARTEQRRNLCPPSQSKLGPSVRFCLRLWYVRTLCEASDYMWVCLRLAPAGAVPVTYTTLSPASQGAPKTAHTQQQQWLSPEPVHINGENQAEEQDRQWGPGCGQTADRHREDEHASSPLTLNGSPSLPRQLPLLSTSSVL